VVGVQGYRPLHQPQISRERVADSGPPSQHRIDDQRFAAGPAGEQVAVSAGNCSNNWRKITVNLSRVVGGASP